jgi:hypothetical protein
MRNWKMALCRLKAGAFWGAVLLILPGCGFSVSTATTRNDAVYCDIEKVFGRHCATASDLEVGIRFSKAAVALHAGKTSSIGLDDSPEALARCGGQPEAVLFQGAFPQGVPVCVNCGDEIGSGTTVLTRCQQRCYNYFGSTSSDGTFIADNPPDPSVKAFCDATTTTRLATNQPLNTCFADACVAAGAAKPEDDPRKTAAPVLWIDRWDVEVVGPTNTDLRKKEDVLTQAFDSGAVSQQRIHRGDGFLEFGALRNDQGHAIGLSQFSPVCTEPCEDTDPSLNDITFAVVLATGGKIGIIDNGVNVVGPDSDGTFGPYSAGERFRIRANDNLDGSASLSLSRIGTCSHAATECPETPIYVRPAPFAYPFRIDASLRVAGATLTDVRMVFIH